MTERQYKGQSLWEFPDNYTVVDIETNGYFKNGEIIEISALKVRDNIVVDTFSSLIKPQVPINWFITKLTGITNKMLSAAPPPLPVLEGFLTFVQDDVILGYNVNFDVNFLYDACLAMLNVTLTNNFVDVLRFARKALPNLENHKQTTVAEYFGLETQGAHRALRDCEICDGCYRHLRRMLQ